MQKYEIKRNTVITILYNFHHQILFNFYSIDEPSSSIIGGYESTFQVVVIVDIDLLIFDELEAFYQSLRDACE